MVPGTGLEPARGFPHYHLKVACIASFTIPAILIGIMVRAKGLEPLTFSVYSDASVGTPTFSFGESSENEALQPK